MKRLLVSGLLVMFATGAWAQDCTVNDPTGTPLNVRARPNGQILGALHNGVTVHIVRLTTDDSGRPWAYIVPLEGGKSDWVFRSYLACR